MSADLTLTNFWSHAMAAALFVSLIIWRVKIGVRHPAQRLMLAGFALTACWAWLTAIAPASQIPALAETVRNLIWVSVLHRLSTLFHPLTLASVVRAHGRTRSWR